MVVMNKIVAAFDGLRFSKSNMQYATEIAKLFDSHLTGVFLDDRTYTSYKIYDLVFDQGISDVKMKKYRREDIKLRNQSAVEFSQYCRNEGIEFNVHHDRDVAINELLHESIFSDLLLISNEESFTHHQEKFPSRFIRDLLSDIQSPVLLTPDKYHKADKLIFLYDGDPASVYAIKMFNYLFDRYADLPAEILTIKSMESNLHLPEHKLMKEFMKQHYKHLEYTILKGIPEEEIVGHLKNEKKSFMVILGAYRRTMLSRWFRSSIADTLIRNFNVPIFIAHN